MCYSAQVWQAYQKYARRFSAEIDFPAFVRLYGHRNEAPDIKTTKAMDDAFAEPRSAVEHRIKALIDKHNAQHTSKLEQEVFKQRKRLADAERTLQTKTTKKALNDRRVATDKVERALAKLADLKRTELEPRDSRIFPGVYSAVMIEHDGRRCVMPMRYQCRIEGKPASYDHRYPGTYNARRDNLERFWKPLFGHRHGIIVAQRFYENVTRVADHGATRNAVLEFVPEDGRDMLIACLWSRWTASDEPDMLSFAAITDEPPAEIAAAGHDRCIIPIKPEYVDAWLKPAASNLDAMQAILDDRERPYYEHRIAA